jgi:hypothetical protein
MGHTGTRLFFNFGDISLIRDPLAWATVIGLSLLLGLGAWVVAITFRASTTGIVFMVILAMSPLMSLTFLFSLSRTDEVLDGFNVAFLPIVAAIVGATAAAIRVGDGHVNLANDPLHWGSSSVRGGVSRYPLRLLQSLGVHWGSWSLGYCCS